MQELDEWRSQGVETDFCVIGNKGGVFFRRMAVNLLASTTHIGDQPGIDDLVGTIKVVLDAYSAGNIDRLFFVYNEFVNSMTQRPVVEQLLPRHRPRRKRSSTTGTISTSRTRGRCWTGS